MSQANKDQSDETILRQTIETANRRIRIPFSVNIKDLDASTLSWLMDTFENSLGGKYFRTKELLEEVLRDQIEETNAPLKFLHGPYLAMKVIKDDVRRITSEQVVPGGCTVYAFDQIVDFVNEYHAEKLAEKAEAAKPTQAPSSSGKSLQ